MTRKDHPHFKEKGSWASKSLSSLNPDNTWQSCDLNSEVSDSKALTFFSMPNCLSVLGMGDPDTHTHTHTRFSFAAAAAKSLQLCPTLCDPIDGSPPGSPVPGILQARTLEWVAISFSNAWKWKVKVKVLSRVRLLATPWTGAYQARPWDFPGKSTGVGCHCLLFSLASHVQSLRPHRLQHTSPPCPLLSPGVCPSSCPLTQWCHSTISSFAALFSFWLQSFPVSRSFPMCVCMVC